jgi:hypothetical protein
MPVVLHCLTLAWTETVAVPALSLVWSALRLWDYPRPAPKGACGAAPPEPG